MKNRLTILILLACLPAMANNWVDLIVTPYITVVNNSTATYSTYSTGGSCPRLKLNASLNGSDFAGCEPNTPLAPGATARTGGVGAYACSGTVGTRVTILICDQNHNNQIILGSIDLTDDDPNGNGKCYRTMNGTIFVNGNDCSFTASNAPCVTNIVFNLQNNDSVPHAYGVGQLSTVGSDPYCPYQIGVASRSTSLAGAVKTANPGQSVQFNVVVPCDKISDYALFQDNSTSGPSTGSDGTNQWYCFDSAINTQTTPTPAPSSGTVNGLPTNSVSSSWNPSGAIWTPTNSLGQIVGGGIIWTPSSSTNPATATQIGSSALYDAVNKGFQQTHNDLQAINNGLTNIHVSFNGTNNFTSASNVWVENWPSNFFGAYGSNGATEGTLQGISNLLSMRLGSTNDALTNYAEETTLRAVSNLFGSSLTNSLFNSNFDYTAAASTYPSQGSNALATALDLSAVPSSESYGDPIGETWSINVNLLGVEKIDLNPFHQSWVVDLASFFRSAITWISRIGLYWHNIDTLLAAVRSLGATRQATASGQSVFGVNANLVSAVTMAVLITTVMLAVPLVGLILPSFQGVSLSNLVANPFHYATGQYVRISIYIADQFFPIAFMFYCTFCAMVYRLSLGAILWSVQTLTRFLVG